MNDRTDWEMARHKSANCAFTIGGSDAAAVLGISPYKTRIELYNEKRRVAHALAVTGQMPPNRSQSSAMESGHYFETAILKWYSDASGSSLASARDIATKWKSHDGHIVVNNQVAHFESHFIGSKDVIFRSSSAPWMLGSVDTFAIRNGELGIIDAKNVNMSKRGEWTDTTAPPYLQAQMDHYLAMTGLSWGGFAVCFGGQQLGWIEQPRNEERISRLISAECEFIRRLESAEPPDDDVTARDLSGLRRLYGNARDRRGVAWPVSVCVPGMPDRLSPAQFDQSWKDAHFDLKIISERIDSMKVAIHKTVGHYDHAVMPDGTKYKISKSGTIKRKGPPR